MKLNQIFLVRNPSDKSELADIMFPLYSNELARYIIGCGLSRYEQEQHVMHDDKASALEDAQARMNKRGIPKYDR